jgi:hypothetical protein
MNSNSWILDPGFSSTIMETGSVHRLQILLLAIYLAGALLLWPSLPARIPMHFDMNGHVTDWADTTIFTWFGLPFLAVATTLLLYGSGRLAARTPSLWNLPEKKRFLALTPEERAPIEQSMYRLLAWTAVAVTFTFIGVHTEIYRTALGGTPGRWWESILLILLPVILLLVYAVRSTRSVGEQIRQASEYRREESEVRL